MSEEHTRRVAETISQLLNSLSKYDSFLLTFTPIHDPSKSTADTHFKDAISICYVTKENTQAISVSAGFHEAKVTATSDFLREMHIEMTGNSENFEKGFHLGSAVSEHFNDADTYIRYRTDLNSDTEESDD